MHVQYEIAKLLTERELTPTDVKHVLRQRKGVNLSEKEIKSHINSLVKKRMVARVHLAQCPLGVVSIYRAVKQNG